SFDLTVTDVKKCSVTQHFELEIVAAGCSAETSAIAAPADGSTADGTRPVTFVWARVTGATSYEILTSNDGGATYRVVAATSNPNATTATVSLSAGSYIAVVRTIF